MNDFIVTAHALERLEERFPELVGDEEDQARLIHEEVMEAIDSGRTGSIAPLELASWGAERWETRKRDSFYAWRRDKARGYLISGGKDMVVITVLAGMSIEQARTKITRP